MYSFSDDEDEGLQQANHNRGEGSSSSAAAAARMRQHATPPPLQPAAPRAAAAPAAAAGRKSKFNQQETTMVSLDDDDDDDTEAGGAAYGSESGRTRSRSPSLLPPHRSAPHPHRSSGPGGRAGGGGRASPSLSTFTDQVGLNPFTQAPAIDRLQRLWVAERSCPEILSWSSADGGGGERWRCDETVDEVCAQIEEQMSILNLLSSDEGTSEEEHLRLSMVQLDVERSKWLLRAFLRTRLHKLESYAMHYSSLAPTRRSQILSPLEQAYLTKYTSIQHAHLSSSVLDYLPEPLRSLTDGAEEGNTNHEGEGEGSPRRGATGGMVPRPDMGSPVFIRCTDDCGEVRTEDGESANLSRGSVHILTFGSVRTLVLQGRVELL